MKITGFLFDDFRQAVVYLLAASALFDQLQGLFDLAVYFRALLEAWRSASHSFWNSALGVILGELDPRHSSMLTASLFVGLSFIVPTSSSARPVAEENTASSFIRSLCRVYLNALPVAVVVALMVVPAFLESPGLDILYNVGLIAAIFTVFGLTFVLGQFTMTLLSDDRYTGFDINTVSHQIGKRARRVLAIVVVLIGVNFIGLYAEEIRSFLSMEQPVR